MTVQPHRVSDRPPHRRTPSGLQIIDEGLAMSASDPPLRPLPARGFSSPPTAQESEAAAAETPGLTENPGSPFLSPNITPSSPPMIGLSRTGSFSASSLNGEDDETFPPLDRLSVFDLLENLALPQRLEKWQTSVSAQTAKLQERQKRLRASAKDKVIEEWRRRVPTPEEQLDKYRKRMRESVDRLGRRWKDEKTVTTREKISFIAGTLNIFISGLLIGGWPEYFHYWYTAQLLYFMPIRYYTYHKRGYHYFLADLCYFVNLLCFLSIWVFPNSKRLFISSYCLAFGNNAVAIAMWRNSLVFHSFDKVTSLFIHIMPPVALHCLVHLVPKEVQKRDFPAIHTILYSDPKSPEHYSLAQMVVWATVPYAIWQLSYHFLITVRRRAQIAAGRPTSFTWLRKSYASAPIGKFVLALPEALQEPAFMLIQYSYAVLTMVPCPLWFWYRWASTGFLMAVFIWSIYNGATYYIDVFGKRFQKELEALRKDVAKWQESPGMEGAVKTPGPLTPGLLGSESPQKLSLGAAAGMDGIVKDERSKSLEAIPPLEEGIGSGMSKRQGNGDLRERK